MKIKTIAPFISMMEKMVRFGFSASSLLIRGEGWFYLLFSSDQDCSSVTGKDEPNLVLWLATRAGTTRLSCPIGITRSVPLCLFPCNKSLTDKACSVKRAKYWPRSFLSCLWTSTPSRSINTQKKKLANIQSLWPHTLTNMCCTFFCSFSYVLY